MARRTIREHIARWLAPELTRARGPFPIEARAFQSVSQESQSAPATAKLATFYDLRNPLAHNGLNVLAASQIGTGARPESLHPSASEEINAAVERWWPHADAEGVLDFGGQQHSAVRSMHLADVSDTMQAESFERVLGAGR